MKARVYRSAQRMFDCKISETNQVVSNCWAKGNLLKEGQVVVGDYVLLEQQEHGDYAIQEVLPRKNEIFRMVIRENKKKITAANIDYLVIVLSCSHPAYKRGLLDRYLVRTSQWDIPALVVFNKIDELVAPEKKEAGDFNLQEEVQRLHHLQIPFYALSARYPQLPSNPLSLGMPQLLEALKGSTAIFIGPSGVGKSKMITALSQGQVQLRSHELGKANKGTHTTTWCEVVDCPEFALVDSPGIRSFSLDDIMVEELQNYFPDLREWSLHCKFEDCLHDTPNEHCAFYRSNFIPESLRTHLLTRLESFHQIYAEISRTPTWKKKKNT